MSVASTNYFYKIKNILTALLGKADVNHNHDSDYLAADTDILVQSDLKTINNENIAGTGNISLATATHTHDTRYYTKEQVDALTGGGAPIGSWEVIATSNMSGIQIHEFTDVNYDEIRLLIRGKTSSSTDYNKPDIYAGVDSLTLKNFSYALHGYLGGSVTQGGQDQKQNIAMSVTPNSNEAQSYDISFKDFSKATQATFTGLFTGRTNGYNYSSIGHIGGVQNDSAALGYMKIDLGSTLWSGEITLLGVNYA